MCAKSLGTIESTGAGSRFLEALESLKPAMLAIPVELVKQPNIDIPHAVTLTLGAMPAIMATRPDFLKHLPTFPIELLDTLESRTLAMDYANTMRLMSTKELEPLPQLLTRGTQRRTLLIGEAKYAVLRGLMDGGPLAELSTNNSHRGLATDLFALAYLLRANWPAIQGKSALTLEELAEAEQDADHIITALGARKQAVHGFDPSSDLRERAFTLYIQAYTRVRASIEYLFPDTVDQVIPNIHITRGAGKRRLSEEEIVEEIRTATGVHAAVKDSEAGQPDARTPDAPAAAVGMPGSSPYTE